MKSLFFVVIPLFLLLSVTIQAQVSFAEKCLGTWKGTMYISAQNEVKDSIPVQFTVADHPDAGAHSWKMEYISPSQPITKDYILRQIDLEKGLYAIDEGDGVVLDAYLFGNSLFSSFEVNDLYITTTYQIQEDQHLIFDLIVSKKGQTTSKGEIQNYVINNRQRVVLRPAFP
jgi:hypothetical protein